MARKRDRAFALGLALLFLLTSAGFSIAVIVQMHNDSKQKSDVQKQLQDQINQQKDTSMNLGKLTGFDPMGDTKVTSLQKIDTVVGTGDEVKPGDTVTAKYTGAYTTDGQIFDSSDAHGGNPISFPLSGVIKGWTDGVPGMKVGGKRRLLIPADQAYGANPPSGLRANADMVFDIELTKIGQ